MALELNKIRSAQINEKVYAGDTANPVPAYDIILPESRADLIKETFGAVKAEWKPQTKYVAGETVWVVDQAGAVASYECKESHVSGNVFEIGYWKLIVSRRFVTPQDEQNWRDGGYALKYKGNYSAATTYKKYDLVSYIISDREEYFISMVDENKGVAPELETNDNWRNLNIWANKAGVSEKIKTENIPALLEDNDSVLLTFVVKDGNNEEYTVFTDSKLVYEVNSNYLHVMSEYADKYMRAFDNNGNAVTPEAKSLNDEFKAIYAAIKTISGGDLVLGHGLTIKLNGEALLDNWMAQEDGSVNIELNSDDIQDWSTKLDEEFANRADTKYVRYDAAQELTPEQQAQARANINAAPVADYVIKGADGKISVSELPDTVVGGLQYKGVYNASVAGSIVPEMGDYYIVSEPGNYDPAGGVHTAANPEVNYFLVGDWAIYNGTEGWAKIDNTDAVKTVNGQIGAVKTYKGVYSEETEYYAGDWVLVNGILYLAVENSKGQSVEDEAYWQVAGRIYEGEKGIAINGNKIGHTNVLTTETEEAKAVAAKGGQFSVDVNEYDAQGHVIKTKKQNITLSQSWREVKIGETAIVAANSDEALSIAGNAPITVEGDAAAHTVYVKHNAGTEVKDGIELTIPANGQVTANVVSSDAFGHVNGTRELKLINLALKDGAQTLSGVKTYKNDLGSGSVILPESPEVYDLGSTNSAFRTIYAKEFKGDLAGNAATATQWATARYFKFQIDSGTNVNAATQEVTQLIGDVASHSIDGTVDRTWVLKLAKSGVKAGAYTAVKVNEQGIVTGGGQAIEFGESVGAEPSSSLVFGGLFFRMIESE